MSTGSLRPGLDTCTTTCSTVTPPRRQGSRRVRGGHSPSSPRALGGAGGLQGPPRPSRQEVVAAAWPPPSCLAVPAAHGARPRAAPPGSPGRGRLVAATTGAPGPGAASRAAGATARAAHEGPRLQGARMAESSPGLRAWG